MTIVIWAASDDFALLVTDRRALVPAALAGLLPATKDIGQGTFAIDKFVKANVSDDGRDIVGFSGEASSLHGALFTVLREHGIDGDRALNAELNPADALDGAHAIDVAQEPSNALLHAYSRDGKMVCSRFEWTRAQRYWLVIGSRPDRIQITAVGSGAPYLAGFLAIPAEAQRWQAIQSNANHAEGLHAYLLRVVGAVAALHDGVSVDTKSWILRKGSTGWIELDGSSATSAPGSGMAALPEPGL